jgi:hypothetical protein
VKKLYLLIRAKRGNQAEERLLALLNEKVFHRWLYVLEPLISSPEPVFLELENFFLAAMPRVSPKILQYWYP